MVEALPRDLEPYLIDVRAAPRDNGRVELIVRRPAEDEREVLTEANLDPASGLVGDTWAVRGSRMTADGSANPAAQITVMSVRVLRAFEPEAARWPLAGDQLYVDLDLSIESLPAGSRLAIGSAVLEVSRRTRAAPSSAPGSAVTPCAGSTPPPAGPTGCAA
jgi:hypothetical protein